ncbi:MAG: glycosyl transferase family 2 [Firmicutes bacterium]|nr:glycosyl transferase family 2 [Bacillota bacterium]
MLYYINDSEHYVRVMVNKAIIFWLQDNAFKVRSITDSLILVGLDDDFIAIVKLLRLRPNEDVGFVNLRTDSSELLFDILLRAMDHGDFKKVDEILARMEQAWIKTHAYRLMQMYVRHNRLNDAERYGHIYLVSNQDSFDALVGMGDIKGKKAEYWEAAEYYRAAVSVAPCSPKAYVNLLKMYDKLCLETLKTAVEKHPDVELFKAMLEQETARQ